MLNITELFVSVQGESTFAGIPTVFVRLSGCDLRCVWCDTEYAFGKGEEISLDKVYDDIMGYGFSHVCITGGEPLLQKEVYPLMSRLCDANKVVSLETSGAHNISDVDERVTIIMDVKCPGSGMSEKMCWENMGLLKGSAEVKFVIASREDYDYAYEVCRKHDLYDKVGAVLFAPVHGNVDTKGLVSWMLTDKIPARINLQLHKYIWPEAKRGV
ncbi:MAG: radical SAM protein [Waddliaceae bacterium]|jgi:7-carboxy-7-deazaguanine synthase|nr:radical SAM protein [Waddliaceae bacterium]MBT6927985.1 radical SAM protein [Waddliaceae bacterium]